MNTSETKPREEESLETLLDLGRRGHHRECVDGLREYVHRFPDHAEAWGHLGYLLSVLKEDQESIACYERFLELRQDVPEVYKRLGDLYYASGRYRMAHKAYRVLRGTEFHSPVTEELIVSTEFLPKRLLRKFPSSALAFFHRCLERTFWKSLLSEFTQIRSSVPGIRAAGLSRYLTYLSWHYLQSRAYRLPRSPCDLCGSTDFRAVFFYANQKKVKCNCCGLECVERRPEDGVDVSLGIYEGDYNIDYDAKKWENPGILQSRLENLKAGIEKTGEDPIRPGTRVFEIGCGHGHLLNHLKSQGLEVEGIDASARLVNHCRDQLGLNVRRSTIRELDPPRNTYDLVLAYHVAEHLDKPSQLFSKAAQMLHKGGFLLVEVPVPDLTGLPLVQQLHAELGYASQDHMHYFQMETLIRYFESHGFTVVGRYVQDAAPSLPIGGVLGRRE